jgi:hypothetical protein
MCDYDWGTGDRLIIDQGLLDAARKIERRMTGDAAPDLAWLVFAGRTGGAVAWSDYQRIKQSFAKACVVSQLTTSFKRPDFLCEEGSLSAEVESLRYNLPRP